MTMNQMLSEASEDIVWCGKRFSEVSANFGFTINLSLLRPHDKEQLGNNPSRLGVDQLICFMCIGIWKLKGPFIAHAASGSETTTSARKYSTSALGGKSAEEDRPYSSDDNSTRNDDLDDDTEASEALETS